MVITRSLTLLSKVQISPVCTRLASAASSSSTHANNGRLHSGRVDQRHRNLRATFGNQPLLPLVRQPPLQVPALSRGYAVSQPYSEGLKMVTEDEVGSEEVVEGCQLQHGELQNGDVKLHYVECGVKTGDVVILVHGFPNFWYVWKNQFQDLAQAGYHIIAPDLRGYNTSSKPKGLASYGREAVLSDILCFIDHFGGGKPVMVVGHDWGGAVTWALAEDFPHKLKKAVVVNVPHGSVFYQALRSNFRQICRSWYLFFFQLPWLPEHLMTRSDLKSLRLMLEGGACRPCSPTDVERYVTAYSKPGAMEAAINYYRAAFKGFWSSKQEERPVVDLPVDLIWGELDLYIGKELAVAPKVVFPNTVVKFLPKCSHFPMWDDPEQFNHLLLTSLAQHAATGNKIGEEIGPSATSY